MADPYYGYNYSSQNAGRQQEYYDPQYEYQQAADLHPYQRSSQYPETYFTTMPSYTAQHRQVVLQDATREVFASHIRGPSPANRTGREFYPSNSALSYFADVASQQPRIPTGGRPHQEYQQYQPAWQDAPPPYTEQYQPIQTALQPARHAGSRPRPAGTSLLSSREPDGSRQVGRQRDKIEWTEESDKLLLDKGGIAWDEAQVYSWDNLEEEFGNEHGDCGSETRTMQTALKDRYRWLTNQRRLETDQS